MTGSLKVEGDVLLVGSLPFDTAEAAFRESAEGLGNLVPCLPDGEQGQRKFWVNYLPEFIYSEHPDLVGLTRYHEGVEAQPEKQENYRPGAAPENRFTFAIREGVTDLVFDLGYGRFAIESYAIFTRLRDEGVIPEEVKFQVAVPGTVSAVDWFFEDDDDRARARSAYRDAIIANVKEMLEVIPAEDLVFQVDLSSELCDIAIGDETYMPFFPYRTEEQKITEYLGLLAELSDGIPGTVPLGYHWCYGTWGGWPMIDMTDLGLCVTLTNLSVANTSRSVEYVHMPVGETAAEEFYAPLADLDAGDTKVYLGMIHHHEESDSEFRARVATAKRYLPNFGISAVCGYGRTDPAEVGDLYAAHRRCAEALHSGDTSSVTGS
jgi:hypothetical protein